MCSSYFLLFYDGLSLIEWVEYINTCHFFEIGQKWNPTLDPVLDLTLNPVLDLTLDPTLDLACDLALGPTLDLSLGAQCSCELVYWQALPGEYETWFLYLFEPSSYETHYFDSNNCVRPLFWAHDLLRRHFFINF